MEHDVDEGIDTLDIIGYLVDTIAASSPEATVEFHHVSFVSGHVHGALKRLLPPHRGDEALLIRSFYPKQFGR